MSAPATCRHCGEQAGSTGSLSGLVHRWGPKDHRFEPLPTAEQSNAVVERMIAAETTILSAPATHPCDACGGTGDAWPDRELDPCPVCLGAGSFPDRMPARDAIADAETLHTYCSTFFVSGRTFDDIDGYGWQCAKYIATKRPHIEASAQLAMAAARAAFRAVPGLRGE